MKVWCMLLVGLGLLLLGTAATQAQDNLSVRLVEGIRNQPVTVDPALNDVKDLLARNLPTMALKLLDKKSVRLPASQQYELEGKVFVTLKGKADSLSVTLQRGDDVVNATVTLQPGKPFLVGGFPTGNGKLILILQTY